MSVTHAEAPVVQKTARKPRAPKLVLPVIDLAPSSFAAARSQWLQVREAMLAAYFPEPRPADMTERAYAALEGHYDALVELTGQALKVMVNMPVASLTEARQQLDAVNIEHNGHPVEGFRALDISNGNLDDVELIERVLWNVMEIPAPQADPDGWSDSFRDMAEASEKSSERLAWEAARDRSAEALAAFAACSEEDDPELHEELQSAWHDARRTLWDTPIPDADAAAYVLADVHLNSYRDDFDAATGVTPEGAARYDGDDAAVEEWAAFQAYKFLRAMPASPTGGGKCGVAALAPLLSEALDDEDRTSTLEAHNRVEAIGKAISLTRAQSDSGALLQIALASSEVAFLDSGDPSPEAKTRSLATIERLLASALTHLTGGRPQGPAFEHYAGLRSVATEDWADAVDPAEVAAFDAAAWVDRFRQIGGTPYLTHDNRRARLDAAPDVWFANEDMARDATVPWKRRLLRDELLTQSDAAWDELVKAGDQHLLKFAAQHGALIAKHHIGERARHGVNFDEASIGPEAVEARWDAAVRAVAAQGQEVRA